MPDCKTIKKERFTANKRFPFSMKYGFCCLLKRYHLFKILTFLFLLNNTSFAQFGASLPEDYIFKKWDTSHGLPQKSVNDILQAKNGYLWVATYEGFSRFDGVTFETFDKSTIDGLETNIIYDLEEDADNNIWIGTNGGGVLKYKNGKSELFTSENGKLLHDVVRCIYADTKGNVWIASDGGLHCYKDGKIKKYTTQDGLTQNLINEIIEDSDGNLWLSVTGKGIDIFKNGKVLKNYNTKDGLPYDAVLTFCKDENGTIWAGTRAGLAYFKNGKFHTVKQKGLDKYLIRSLHYDTFRNVIWAGTGRGKLFNIKGGKTVTQIKTAFGNHTNINSIKTDLEGNIWIGFFKGGLCRIKKSLFNTLLSNKNLEENVNLVVTKSNKKHNSNDEQKKLYIGTNGQGIAVLENGKFSHITKKDGLTKNQINSLLEDRNGNIWAGTYRGWLNKIAPNGKVTHYKKPSGITNSFASAIFEDSKGTIWVGTYGSGLFYKKNKKFNHVFIENDKETDTEVIRVIFEAEDKTLWVGTNTGVVHITDKGAEKLTTNDGLSFKTIIAIYQDKNDDGIWFGTRGGGLNYYKDGKFTVCSAANGLFNDVAFAILDDGLGKLWMSCNKGIYTVEKQQLYDFVAGKINKVNSKSYGLDDGMKTIECSGGFSPAACKTDDGKLCFPTAEGLVIINPKKKQIEKSAPIVDIQIIKADSNVYKIYTDSTLVFDKKINKLEIDYTALSLTSPQKIIFRTKLDGLDKTWIKVGKRRTSYYTNLPHGTYTFRVSASNGNNLWSEKEARITIVIPTPYWKTAWFQFVVILWLGSSLYVVYFMRIRAMKRQKIKLKKTVERRTLEITRQKETLLQLNKEKDSLIAIVAHDLKSPLNQIKGLTMLLNMENPDFPVQTKDYITKIAESSERLNNMIAKILDINTIESKGFKISLEESMIDKVVEETVKRYQPTAEKKQIKLFFFKAENIDYKAIIDKSLFVQAIENLVSNAVKFSPSYLNIVVRVFRIRGKVRVSVKDEGAGITKEDMPKLFGKFQKLTARPTAGEDSTGLGLSIVKKYIEIMKGKVWCESEEGKGADFIIEI